MPFENIGWCRRVSAQKPTSTSQYLKLVGKRGGQTMGGQSFAVRDCRNTQYIEHRQLLLSLVFTPAEASERLAEIIGQDQVQGIRLPSIYSRLARITGPSRHLIDDRISTRLGMV
ncbi:MAG: hypothetical protein VX223_14005, partial [Myxococcota bacterium]|nr:hypothetical protein [Myxococcota bacterium]